MKKLISIIVMTVMLVCVILPFTVNADVLWTEDFSSVKENDWIWDGDLFFIENGKLEGWAEAVVHQSNFLIDRGAPRRYKECAWKVECAGLEDGGHDSQSHYMGLWFADYISPTGSNDPDGQIVYNFGYEFESHALRLTASFDGDGENYKPATYDDSKPLGEYIVPDAQAPELNSSGNDTFTLGMRINGGKIDCFFNDQKVISYNAVRGTTTATQLPSPVLLINGGCHCTWDNLVVATPDYNLFNESSTPANNDPGNNEPAETETEKRIETKVVHETNEAGEDVTVIVTEEVVVPVANTGRTNTGTHSSSKTGDVAIIVAVVMAVALGSAIVVKKVCLK